jgi:hypothetical protein
MGSDGVLDVRIDLVLDGFTADAESIHDGDG